MLSELVALFLHKLGRDPLHKYVLMIIPISTSKY